MGRNRASSDPLQTRVVGGGSTRLFAGDHIDIYFVQAPPGTPAVVSTLDEPAPADGDQYEIRDALGNASSQPINVVGGTAYPLVGTGVSGNSVSIDQDGGAVTVTFSAQLGAWVVGMSLGGGASSGAGGTLLVYQPDGVTGGYIYADFGELCTVAIGLIVKTIFFDSSHSPIPGTCNIPAGVYDAGENCAWMGDEDDANGNGTIITCDPGTTLGTLPEKIEYCQPMLTGPAGTTSGVWTIASGVRTLICRQAFWNGGSESGVAIHVSSGAELIVFLSEDAEVFSSSDPTTRWIYVEAGGTAAITVGFGSAVFENILGSAIGGTTNIAEVDHNAAISRTQSALLGGFGLVLDPPVQGEQLEFPFAMLFSTASAVFVMAGARSFNADILPPQTYAGATALQVQFVADVRKTGGATSVEVELFDVTHSTLVTGTDLTSTSTNGTVSAVVTVGAAAGDLRNDVDTLYEVRVKMNGGGGGDTVSVLNARLVVSYV